MIKDMQEEIRLEKYNTERQIVIENQEAAMRDVQLEETWHLLRNFKSAFMEYVVDTEEQENVNKKKHTNTHTHFNIMSFMHRNKIIYLLSGLDT